MTCIFVRYDTDSGELLRRYTGMRESRGQKSKNEIRLKEKIDRDEIKK